ncbi:MAG: hypothetical protein AAGA68_25455 [Pseudomonadota bacterium]
MCHSSAASRRQHSTLGSSTAPPWLKLALALLASGCTLGEPTSEVDDVVRSSGHAEGVAAESPPHPKAKTQSPLEFGDIGVYGSHWVDYLAHERTDFDFIMYQARIHAQAPEDLAGDLSLLATAGVRLVVVAMFFESKSQRAARDDAPPLKSLDHYEAAFAGMLNATASLEIEIVTIDEENRAANAPFLSDLYDRVKRHYPAQDLYQWYSPTRKPSLAIPGKTRPAMPADGWVIDNYGVHGNDFFEYIAEMDKLDKPLLAVVWASPQWQVGDRSRRRNTRWWDSQGWKVFHSKLATYQHFEVPVAFFMFAPLDPDNPGYIPLYQSSDECSQNFLEAFRTRTIPRLRSSNEIPTQVPENRPAWIPGHCG